MVDPFLQQSSIVLTNRKISGRAFVYPIGEARGMESTLIAKLGADLKNPDSVETILATEYSEAAMKHETVNCYVAFCKAFKMAWEPIKVQYEPKVIFLPTEQEIDLLIGACGKVTTVFLQVLKDTAARAGEIRQLEWTDVDPTNNTIAINHPGKGSDSRTVKVSDKTIAAINSLPKKYGDHVFNPKRLSAIYGFMRTRKRLAERFGNPRLLEIHYHTLRHWKATDVYAKTREIYAAKKS